ncbi:MAG: alpha/beta fold hydrolase [Armatimonadia bacterium]|nr:alpha/beta fold hydrolase [Armatimonadia bacterium]
MTMGSAFWGLEPIECRDYGDPERPEVVVLHGGPAAVGNAAPIARALADQFRVLEPLQRGSGDEPLTVARHVSDLAYIIADRCRSERPAIVGESWGAMLALAFAAAHPDMAGPLVLVGCGTFDPRARERMRQTIQERQGEGIAKALADIAARGEEATDALEEMLTLTRSVYDYDPIEPEAEDDEPVRFDARAHEETWSDMVRLQEEGVYPTAFRSITGPVLMLHGEYDPHPGQMIRDSLLEVMPHLEYHAWDCCGHSPWMERQVRTEFYGVLARWLSERTRS